MNIHEGKGEDCFFYLILTLSKLVAPKCTLWHNKHFITVYTVCYDKNNLQRKKCNFYLKIITCDPSVYTMGHPKFIASN